MVPTFLAPDFSKLLNLHTNYVWLHKTLTLRLMSNRWTTWELLSSVSRQQLCWASHRHHHHHQHYCFALGLDCLRMHSQGMLEKWNTSDCRQTVLYFGLSACLKVLLHLTESERSSIKYLWCCCLVIFWFRHEMRWTMKTGQHRRCKQSKLWLEVQTNSVLNPDVSCTWLHLIWVFVSLTQQIGRYNSMVGGWLVSPSSNKNTAFKV